MQVYISALIVADLAGRRSSQGRNLEPTVFLGGDFLPWRGLFALVGI